jgi:hypothetical protein
VSAEKKQALRQASRATEKAMLARAARDTAIRDALEVCSVREVARSTGLSAPRIHQIRHGR